MLCKRIVPCLDIDQGRTVKGVNFKDIKDAGCPLELAARYEREGADELVFLDITASVEKRNIFVELVRDIAKLIRIPFTVGGGIVKTSDVERLLRAGADKVSINSAAVKNPDLLDELVGEFGSQCIVLAVDSKLGNSGENIVCVSGGRELTKRRTEEWIHEGVSRGVGEILLTSMGSDGTKAGFDIELLKKVNQDLSVPLIASGGAGTMEHFLKVFSEQAADAALAASVFHFDEISITDLKYYLHSNSIEVRYGS